MRGLRELQGRFVAAVLHRQDQDAGCWLRPLPLTAADRLHIYRTTARENFALALEAAFPLLLMHMGGREFRQMAWAYQRAHPSPSGNLFHVGAALPGYLGARLAGTPDVALVDVARLEWACQLALVAPEAPPLDLAALAAVPGERQASLVFRLHPAVALVAVEYPVFDAWQALQAGARPAPAAAAAPEWLLVQRQRAGIVLYRLTEDEFRWLEALRDGVALGRLVAEYSETGQRLARWAGRGVIQSCLAPGPDAAPAVVA